jgi:RHS repeat-associated protein
VTTYAYDNAGRLTAKSLPNGMRQTYDYDDANRLTQIRYLRADGSVLEAIAYLYDPKGQRIQKTFGVGSVSETPFTAQYDAADRMSTITFTGTGETCTLGYDANGNLATKTCPFATTTYTWDSQNRLISLQGNGLTASFQYDALGRRIERTVNGQTTRYVYDGLQAIAEIRASQTTNLLTGLEIDEMIARYTNGSQRVYLTDALSSVIAQTREDQSVQNFYLYSPYGQAVSSTGDEGNDIEYTARENDNTGLYYYRARYYDPVLKRFVSEDPIGLLAGLNLHAYVNGNPVRFRDPLGFDPFGLGPFSEVPEVLSEISGSEFDPANFDPSNPSGRPPESPHIFPPNGNLWPGFSPQDYVCTSPASSLNKSPCTKACCIEHDACYERYGCNLSSWARYNGSTSCAICDQRAVQCVLKAWNEGCNECED